MQKSIVALTGDVMTMPGLPKRPAALNMDAVSDGPSFRLELSILQFDSNYLESYPSSFSILEREIYANDSN